MASGVSSMTYLKKESCIGSSSLRMSFPFGRSLTSGSPTGGVSLAMIIGGSLAGGGTGGTRIQCGACT